MRDNLRLFKVFLLLIFAVKGLGQIPTAPKSIQSPTTASLGAHGNIPVSPFTGKPDINVNLHTISEQGMQIPISLNYDASGVRPDAHPGWVGLNWNLSATYAVVRTMKDGPDDHRFEDGRGKLGYYFTANLVNDNNWNTPAGMQSIADQSFLGRDMEPDEYSFNLPDITGKFYLGHDGTFKVQCDRPVKVEWISTTFDAFPPFTPPTNQVELFSIWKNAAHYREHAKGFYITDEFGTRYEFGGNNSYCEYGIDFFAQGTETWNVNSWYLKQIKKSTGQVIDFTYERGAMVAQMYFSLYQASFSKNGGGFLGADCSSTPALFQPSGPFNGKLISPIYLKSITTQNAKVNFVSSQSTELRYDDQIFGYIDWYRYALDSPQGHALDVVTYLYPCFYPPATATPGCVDTAPSVSSLISSLQWRKLDKIQIQTSAGTTLKEFEFTYNNVATERLMLKKIQEKSGTKTLPAYQFSYFESTGISLPAYLRNHTDHWGFNNGQKLNQASDYVSPNTLAGYGATFRSPNSDSKYVKLNTLTKIQYPTGGFTEFEFEPHTYSKEVQLKRWLTPLDTYTTNQLAGGLRIKQIKSYDPNISSSVMTKNYLYVSGFNAKNPTATLLSSGVLGGKSQYYWTGYQPKPNANYTINSNIFSTQSVLPATENSQGSHIGYSEVVESDASGGWTVHKFTNFDNGYLDLASSGSLQPSSTAYQPYNSIAYQRGKKLSEDYYLQNGNFTLKKTYQYTLVGDLGSNSARGEKTLRTDICDSDNWLYEATAYLIDVRKFLPTEETTYVYDEGDASKFNPSATVTAYKPNGQIKEVHTTDSKTSSVKVSLTGSPTPVYNRLNVVAYKYPNDYTDGIFPAMTGKNIIAPPIEITTRLATVNAGSITFSPLKWTKVSYKAVGSTYLPEKMESKLGAATTASTDIEFLTYDVRGNLLTYKEKNGSTTKLEYYGTTDIGKTDLVKKRTSADGTTMVQSTSYDYKPVAGVEKITDPSGKVNYYVYDDFLRLAEIREGSAAGNLIQSFHYKYSTSDQIATVVSSNPAVDTPSSPVLGSGPGNICAALTKVRLKWSTSNFNRLNGAKIQGSNDGSTWTDLYTINVNGIDGWQEFPISTTTVYGHIRYVSAPTGYGELREIEFYSGATKLSGTKFGSDPNVSGMPWLYALDGNESTTWHGEYQGVGAHAGASNFVGLSLSCATTCIKPDIIKTVGTTVCQSSNETVTLMASGCSGNVTWFLNGVQVGTGGTYTTNLAGTYTAKCSSGSCSSVASAGLVVTQTSTCAPPNYGRVVIIGNSITKLIAQSGTDGWQSPALTAAGGWGRASSTQAKDFAHILETRFKQLDPNAKVLPLWEAPFERDYISSPAGWLTYDYTALQNRITTSSGASPWKPDLIIIRLGENVVNGEVELNNFKGAYNTLINKVLEVSSPGARVIVTNSMWPDQPLANTRIQQVATERGLPFVDLSDMISNPVYLAGNDPVSMAAFPNNTGDRHPGDAGMLEIADRIWSKVQNVNLPSNIGGNITKVRLYPRTETCCIARIAGSVIQGSNDISNANGWTTLATISAAPVAGWNEYTIRTTTAWRYIRFLAGPTGYGDIKELEFYNGNVKLTGTKFGSTTAYNNDPTTYGYGVVFDGQLTNLWSGTAAGPQNYAGLDLGAGCSALTASVLSPANNASVVGTASTTIAGRVTTAISVTTCVPTGTTISSVEIWATTSTGTFPNRMGYAIADATQPGVYKLSAEEGSTNGKWPIAYLDPGTYRFYAVVNTASTSITTAYNTITLTAPVVTGCPALTASVLSPANNASVVGTASTTTAGRVTTAISVTTCVPTGTTITSVEVWAATSTGTFPNRMGYAVADASRPGVYVLSAAEGSANGKWPVAYLDPGTYRFYAVVNTASTSITTAYNTITLTAPVVTGCPALTASVLSPANNASLVGTASTTTAGRVTTAISVTTCVPTGTTISSVEVWAATSTGTFPNRMGYAVADASRPGVYVLSAAEGSANGKWPVAYLDPGTYRFYAVVNTASTSITTTYNTITLTAPVVTGCPALTASVLSPNNNASVVGTASTTTAGRVTTAISVTTCVPTGTTISSVEVWAATSTGTFPNRMGYAVADVSRPGVYVLSAAEGSANGKWPIPYLEPGTYRFYAVVNTASTSITTAYNTITLTAPVVTGCPALTASVLSPANNASLVGTASTTTAGRVTTAISVTTCVPTGTTITSVEVWAATSTGTFPNRMGYAVADASRPGVYVLSAAEGSANGKWPVAYLDPGTYRFYAVVNTASTSITTAYNTITLTAPVTGCSALTASVLSPANNASVVGTASTTTAGRVITAISVTTCVPTGSAITSVEVWAATSTGDFPNRMGYAIADTSQPGVYKLSATEGSANGKWPIAYLDPGTYRFYAIVKTATATVTTGYNTITLTAP
jgi:hypothetical protein